jgi:molybdopterin/thiamine biosynthesis adenylyltransferase
MNLSDEQIERYSRHILLPELGSAGQEKLLAGRVLLIGVGGLGSPAGMYLAAAGVGTIGVIDSDVVDLSNLQRQIAHATPDLNRPKVESAAETFKAMNPDVNVRTYQARIMADNALDIINDYDFVVDGADNFPTKFLVADACHFADVAYSHAGILRFQGQTMTVVPNESACYRCVFNSPPPPNAVPSCSQAGVLGALAGVIGCLQATEAIKSILGTGDLLTNRLLMYDALKLNFRTVSIGRQSKCPLCGENPIITEVVDAEEAVCDLAAGR